MKSKIRTNEDILKFIDSIQKQAKKHEQRAQVFTTLGLCIGLSKNGICDNTIKRTVCALKKNTDELLDEMLSNKISFGTSKHENVDTEYNRDKLHEMCRQWDFDFDDDIFVRQEMRIGKEKFIL